MRNFLPAAAALAALLAACGSEPRPAAPSASSKPEPAPPHDESRYLPQTNLVDSKVIANHLLDKAFMPGGTLGDYKKGAVTYQVFVSKLADPTTAALLLLDWRKALAGSKLVPAFGAYYGDDDGRPVFVFSKGAWIAGIAGLSEKDVDLPARSLASRLP